MVVLSIGDKSPGSLPETPDWVKVLQGVDASAQGGNHDVHVLEHQPQIGVVRVSGSAGQVVVAQLVHVGCSRLGGNGFQNVAGKDRRAEYGGNSLLLNLIYQVGYVPGRGFGEVCGLSRAHDLHSIALGEVSP